MKIAIVGGGISGLSTYLNLQKHVVASTGLKESLQITVFERHELEHGSNETNRHIPTSGGGYGLAPNGMASLRRLDPAVHEEIVRNGFPSPKTVMKSARGWTLGSIPFLDTRGEHPECCVMVLRQLVLDALLRHIPAGAVVYRKVVDVEDGEESAYVKFADGEREVFDLVIGADGVWSKCRRAIHGDTYGAEYK